MSAPSEIAAGATLLFTATLSGYPATVNAAHFVLNLEGAAIANLAGAPTGNDFIFTAPASTTAAWQPGRYFFAFTANANSGGAVSEVCNGQLSVTPNFAVSATPTAAQIQLAALDAAILKCVGKTNASVSFNGQSYSSRNLKEIFDVRDRLQARVWAEQRAAGLSTRGGGKMLVTRFTNG